MSCRPSSDLIASPLGPSRFSNPLNSHHVAIPMFSPAPGLKEQEGPLTSLDSQRRGHLLTLHPHPLGDNSLSVSCATSDFIACSFSGTVNTAECLKDSQKIILCYVAFACNVKLGWLCLLIKTVCDAFCFWNWTVMPLWSQTVALRFEMSNCDSVIRSEIVMLFLFVCLLVKSNCDAFVCLFVGKVKLWCFCLFVGKVKLWCFCLFVCW